MKSETAFQNRVRDFIHAHGGLTEKIHGNMYQSGLPDLLIAMPNGTIILIELKWTQRLSMRVGEVFSSLRVSQRRFFIQWKDYPVYVLMGSPTGVCLMLADQMPATKFQEWIEFEDFDVTLKNLFGID
jgi:hypothetical protein